LIKARDWIFTSSVILKGRDGQIERQAMEEC